jgi:hypothetical protein
VHLLPLRHKRQMVVWVRKESKWGDGGGGLKGKGTWERQQLLTAVASSEKQHLMTSSQK